jgi:hypothetical protein
MRVRTHVCTGFCDSAQFNEENDVRRHDRDAYKDGYARCRKCELYLKGHDKCPCCNRFLCKKPRNGKFKREYNEMHNVGRY